MYIFWVACYFTTNCCCDKLVANILPLLICSLFFFFSVKVSFYRRCSLNRFHERENGQKHVIINLGGRFQMFVFFSFGTHDLYKKVVKLLNLKPKNTQETRIFTSIATIFSAKLFLCE